MKRRNDFRARNHPAYWAFWLHRVSGLLLALFLPLHFWALGQALHGAAVLQGFLRLADQPLFRFAEWGLVMLLALHMTGGIRLLLIEFAPWSGLRQDWIAVALGAAAAAGMAFALALLG
uniref:Putative succinate dehydrogenase/fumarate reductase cytochrome b-556 subunit n=1 Tax=mine drainage metagenome TaxID=410659 RepID=E6PVC0_9ZZZZ